MTDVVVAKGEEIQVTAAQPAEMVQAQNALILWCSKKIASIRSEMCELQEELDIATKNKWRTASFKRLLALAKGRIIFYGKMQKALKLGYCIVPNFPVTGFAIRTNREVPVGNAKSYWVDFEQKLAPLPEGAGEYKNPFPVVYKDADVTSDAAGKNKSLYYPNAWHELEFPIAMAKPQIMLATEAAMKLNLFDVFGVVPPERKRDPMIIGQIIDPRTPGYGERKRVSFLIAWHLDTSVL